MLRETRGVVNARRVSAAGLRAPRPGERYRTIVTTNEPELSLTPASLTPRYRRPLAGIVIACELDPIGNGAPVPTRPIRPPTPIAGIGAPARFSVPLPSGPIMSVLFCRIAIWPVVENDSRSPFFTLTLVSVQAWFALT